MTLDPTVPDTFLQIADDLDAMASAARRTFTDPLWADDSEAGQEVAQEATFADTWAQRPVQYVLQLAAIAIMMAEDHLVAMAAATRAEHTVFAPLTTTRTVLAASGAAYHLLEPGIGIRARLSRGWTQQLLAYTESLAIFNDDPQSSAFTQAQSRRAAIKASAERHGFDVRAPRWDPSNPYRSQWFIESRAPKEGRLVADVLTSSGGVGATLYRATSAFAHAQPHALAFVVLGPPTPIRPGVSATVVGYGPERLLLYVMGAGLAMHAAISRACQLFGRDGEEWLSTFRPVILRWAQLSRQMRSTDEVPIGEVARQLGLWLPLGTNPSQ